MVRSQRTTTRRFCHLRLGLSPGTALLTSATSIRFDIALWLGLQLSDGTLGKLCSCAAAVEGRWFGSSGMHAEFAGLRPQI